MYNENTSESPYRLLIVEKAITSTLIHEISHSRTLSIIFGIFVSPELSSVRDYVITHSVRSMYVVCT